MKDRSDIVAAHGLENLLRIGAVEMNMAARSCRMALPVGVSVIGLLSLSWLALERAAPDRHSDRFVWTDQDGDKPIPVPAERDLLSQRVGDLALSQKDESMHASCCAFPLLDAMVLTTSDI